MKVYPHVDEPPGTSWGAYGRIGWQADRHLVKEMVNRT
jgi:hypothetical protein